MVEWRKVASFFLVPLSRNNIEQTNAEKIKLIRKKKRQNQINQEKEKTKSNQINFFPGEKTESLNNVHFEKRISPILCFIS